MKKIYILLTFILFLLSWNNSSAQAISNNNLKLNKTIKLFPNPSTDFIKVSELTAKENYKIFTILGSEIKRGSVSNNETIDIRNLNSGVYFLKFDNGTTKKIVKK
ncbi:T9SS type A sorting domain-containing protein [Flavobacteriaceae bacterium]|jgi:hypothetical protein|nr:T9SS type A sorting domain-containing protein [Flavobacterium sp.]MBT7424459.1 T9SS type A sorting domain-containing protein [Flavobacterium sp.]MDB2555564.1 T9SS type A sorting domain-containing protein [Flavobacteriaceae bacterium]MDC3299229.1 T9SS type A sorting domain-containing protein [Flavobacteriaceae bacterium]